MYEFFKKIAFKMDAEKAHHLGLKSLNLLNGLGLSSKFSAGLGEKPVEAMGLHFPNPVGLAAGLDKDGICVDALGSLGFGFLEIGTVTPRPQPGNDKPRLFRIPESQAIINRMGFNNHGVDALVARVKKRTYPGILGINLGKNFDTPLEGAAEDYVIGLRAVYPVADYVAVNISSPNTAGLRELQGAEWLSGLLEKLRQERIALANEHQKKVPILVKIAPDLDKEEVESIAGLLLEKEIDGIIATNTTISRKGVESSPVSQEKGGLSGAPVREMSTRVVAILRECLKGAIPIIGVGGILSAEDAQEKFAAGATLVQIYSGLIYRGPGLIREIVDQAMP